MSNVRLHRMSVNHARPSFLTLACLLLGLAACGGGGDDGLQAGAGPCVVNYAESSLIISSVQNSVSAAPISVVSLSSITVDGMAFDASFLPRNGNVRAVGNTLECTV